MKISRKNLNGLILEDGRNNIYLEPGEIHWGDKDDFVVTILGSCVSICIWHPVKKIGGMTHILMPGKRKKRRGTILNLRYGDDTVWMLLDMIKKHNTNPHEYIVKLFGGANVLQNVQNCSFNTAIHNIQTTVKRLRRYGFSIYVKDLGGIKSRKIVFDISNGDVWLNRIN